MAGCIDDVDARGAAISAVPFDTGALGKNGDPAFLFEIARIHRALFNALVFAESARLAEQLVHQRGLAVVNVGNDGEITDVGAAFSHGEGAGCIFIRSARQRRSDIVPYVDAK
ncbi:MAG: hypothetical protein HC794_07235 [Nitrospiraceae bacterium]|nr:hypothetical protein [Nitrospiraceae bacterium]